MDEGLEKQRPWVFPVRFAVSIALLSALAWHVRHDFTWSSLVPKWTPEAIIWLVAATASIVVGFALATVRWWQTLQALQVRVRLRSLLSHTLAGQFISAFLPGTVGGDVLRMTRLTKECRDGPRAFASVVLERLTGWLVLPAMTIVGLLTNPGLRRALGSERLLFVVSVACVTLAGLGLLLFVANHPRLGGRLSKAEGWQRFLGAVHVGVNGLGRRPTTILGVVGAALLYQLSMVLTFWMVARSLRVEQLGLTALLAFVPVVLMVQVVPISVGGLGVREATLVYLLGALGVPKTEALAVGLLFYALVLAASAVGAPAFAVGARPSGAFELAQPRR
ncbi:MAG: TIGR00374 family protein [Acidimicrobiales bacterium]|nr:MAG: TIGR00374 family protein [Acidimicrobiales bacterium]